MGRKIQILEKMRVSASVLGKRYKKCCLNWFKKGIEINGEKL